jgi:hypothetical protein
LSSHIFSLTIRRIGKAIVFSSASVWHLMPKFVCVQVGISKGADTKGLNLTHLFESIIGHYLGPITLTRIWTELWVFLNTEKFILSRLLFYYQAPPTTLSSPVKSDKTNPCCEMLYVMIMSFFPKTQHLLIHMI